MRASHLAAGMAAICLSSCTVVPKNLGAANARFDQIVKRVKCDLLRAVYTKANQDRARYGFLTQWAAKVHMTLTVDDQASFSPGVSATNLAGNFTFGVGGTVSGQAQRIEDYEFFLSFAHAGPEMTRAHVDRFYDGCTFPYGQLLESDFDFGTIIDRAVSPIEAGLLKQGRQQGPGSSTSPAIPAGEIPAIKQALNAVKDSPILQPLPAELAGRDPRFKEILGKIEFPYGPLAIPLDEATKKQQDKNAKDAAEAIANAPKIAQNVQEVVDNVIRPLYELAITTDLPKKCNIQMQRDRASALASAANAAISKSNIDNAKPEEFKSIIDSYTAQKESRTNVLQKGQAMLVGITQCTEPPDRPQKPTVALYDPIDLIQETVNFHITASGTVAPSWKLVRVSVPLGGPLLSGAAKTTNSLIVTMGRPVTDSSGKQVASQAMNTSLQASLISQAINQRLVP